MNAVSSIATVFHRVKASEDVAAVTLSSGRVWHIAPTLVGSDYVAGETTAGQPQTLVFALAHIEAVSGFTCTIWPQGSAVKSSLRTMLANLSRLAKPVVVHTRHRHWSGLVTAVDSEHLSLLQGNGDSVVLTVAGIHWITVDTPTAVDTR